VHFYANDDEFLDAVAGFLVLPLAACNQQTVATPTRVLDRPSDVALGVADDLAYALGVAVGAWRARSLAGVTPTVSSSPITWRELVGARR